MAKRQTALSVQPQALKSRPRRGLPVSEGQSCWEQGAGKPEWVTQKVGAGGSSAEYCVDESAPFWNGSPHCKIKLWPAAVPQKGWEGGWPEGALNPSPPRSILCVRSDTVS